MRLHEPRTRHRRAHHRHQPGADHIPHAPRSLIETTRIFQRSDIARAWLGDPFVDHVAATREWEHRQWQDSVTEWELKRYFEII
jgi:glutamine synthetase